MEEVITLILSMGRDEWRGYALAHLGRKFAHGLAIDFELDTEDAIGKFYDFVWDINHGTIQNDCKT